VEDRESEDLDLEEDGDLDLKLFLPPRPRPLELEDSFPRLAPLPPLAAPLPRPPREVSENPRVGEIISGIIGLPVILPLIVPDSGAKGSILACPS